MELIDFYRDFVLSCSEISKEKFMKIKLFFEYDDENEIIRDEKSVKRFEFIKDKLFEMFRSGKNMNFEKFVDVVDFLIQKKETELLDKTLTFQEVIFL